LSLCGICGRLARRPVPYWRKEVAVGNTAVNTQKT
jgi:hypothetical protein